MRLLVFGVLIAATAACSILPARAPPKSDFDFGPLEANRPSRNVALNVVLYDITAPAWMDNSSMYYRLAYRNAENPQPYAHSEWVMSPAALLTQRLRSRLASEGTDGARRVQLHVSRHAALHAELVEFEQLFDSPNRSRGVIHLRATYEDESVWAQRTFFVEKSAASADAKGGVGALIDCSEDLAVLLAEWVADRQSDSQRTAQQDAHEMTRGAPR
jgi:cholesterol transport system auxiliary component